MPRDGTKDFILLHVIGSPEACDKQHIPGAQHLHMDRSRPSAWPSGPKTPCSWCIAPDRTATAPTVPPCAWPGWAAR